MDTAANLDPQPRRLALSPSDTIADCARNALAAGAAALERHRGPAEFGAAEALHQVRVAARRIRASIALFAGALYAARLEFYRRDLRWIATQAGAARECDVMAELLKARAAKIGPAQVGTELAGAIAPMIEALALRRASEHRKLCGFLQSRRYRNLIAKLQAPAIKQVGAQTKLGAAAAAALRPIARAAARMGAKLAPGAPEIVFHKLRVRIKRLRYALELLSALGGKRHRKALARLEEMQDDLGLCNDAAVAIAWLRSYAGGSGVAPQSILAAGALIQSIAVRERKLRRRSIKAWRRLERVGLIAEAIAEIRKNGRAAMAAAAPAAPAAPIDSNSSQTAGPQPDGIRPAAEVPP